jgi:hypothetical protein
LTLCRRWITIEFSRAGAYQTRSQNIVSEIVKTKTKQKSLEGDDSYEEYSEELSTKRNTKPPSLLDEWGNTNETSMTPFTRDDQGQRAPRQPDSQAKRQEGGRSGDDETCGCGRGCGQGEGCR